jgi:ATP-dependent exoDNAse (exonuclease V) alpha subunit
MKKIEINNNSFQIPDEFSFIDFSNKQFNHAFEEIFLGTSNLFCQGRAGSGKSLLIKLISKLLKNTIILSTTGITAMALSEDNITAYTLHSFFQISPNEIIDKSSINCLFGKHRQLLEKAECIVIDEVSMMSNQLFDFICDKIEAITHRIPRLILFGDIMQLPPVISTDNKIVENFYRDNYKGKYMIFNSYWYEDLDFKKIMLRKSFRQDNEDLAEMLFKIGYDDHSQETLDYFNQRVMSINKYSNDHSEFMYLSPVNSVVNKINNEYISSLQGKEMCYKAEVSSNWPKGKVIPNKEISIKEGAQIMCTMNNNNISNGVSFYRNGQVGIAKELKKDSIIADIDNKKVEIQKSTINNNELFIDKYGSIATKNNGWYRQIDCKISKACTIHRSQGKTIENVYLVLGNWLPQGMIYVALSRIRDLKGLGLSRPLTMRDIKINEEAFDFLEN